MTIGVDIDEVLAHFLEAFIVFHNKKYGSNANKNNFHVYGLYQTLGGTPEEEKQKILDFYKTDYFQNLPPIEGSIKTLEKLKSKGHNFHAITARHDEGILDTEKWLNKHFPDIFSKIHYVNDTSNKGKKKSDICKLINAEIMIEDNGQNALDCAENNIKSILMDMPWNRNYAHKDMIRVRSWDEILRIIETLE